MGKSNLEFIVEESFCGDDVHWLMMLGSTLVRPTFRKALKISAFVLSFEEAVMVICRRY